MGYQEQDLAVRGLFPITSQGLIDHAGALPPIWRFNCLWEDTENT